MNPTTHRSAEPATPAQPATAAVYPLPPVSDDDPRFCFGLINDIVEVIYRYGYPPMGHPDLGRLLHTLGQFLYQPEDTL